MEEEMDNNDLTQIRGNEDNGPTDSHQTKIPTVKPPV